MFNNKPASSYALQSINNNEDQLVFNYHIKLYTSYACKKKGLKLIS